MRDKLLGDRVRYIVHVQQCGSKIAKEGPPLSGVAQQCTVCFMARHDEDEEGRRENRGEMPSRVTLCLVV